MKKLFPAIVLMLSVTVKSNAQTPSIWNSSSVSTETVGDIISGNGIYALSGQVKAYNIWATNTIKCDANIETIWGEVKGFNVWATNLLKSDGDLQVGGDILADADVYALNGQVKAFDIWATNKIKCDASIETVWGEIKGYNVYATSLMKSDGDLQVGGRIIVGNPMPPTPGGYRLFVKDGILTEKIKVALSSDPTNWSDFVFADEYELRSINDVEEYIVKNKHLPEIPSTEEVLRDGLDLAKMDAKLLQKIEELTLYIIQQQKDINELKGRLNK